MTSINIWLEDHMTGIKEFEKYQKWRDFLEKAEEVEEELDL